MSHTDPEQAEAALKQLLRSTREWPLLERFPIEVGGQALSAQEVIQHLDPFLTERRRGRIREVVQARTYDVATVVDGLANVGNVSAVMRTAEALGYQPFHVVTGEQRYKQSERTSQGAEKWLDIARWSEPAACAGALRARGYRLVAMHLDEEAIPIREVDFTAKTALIFGNEADGVSPAMLQEVDETCIVPLSGFTQSFNVSVAAAVTLYHAQQDRLTRRGTHADLSKEEQEALIADFYLRSIGASAEKILHRLMAE